MLFIQDAYAQAAGGNAGSSAGSLIMMVAIFAIMYFFMFRPQQKKMKEHQALIAGLKKGDEVITGGGLMGRIVNLDQYAIDLEIAKNTVVRIQRPFVTQVLPKGSLKAALGSNDPKPEKADKKDKLAKEDKPAADEPKNDCCGEKEKPADDAAEKTSDDAKPANDSDKKA